MNRRTGWDAVRAPFDAHPMVTRIFIWVLGAVCMTGALVCVAVILF